MGFTPPPPPAYPPPTHPPPSYPPPGYGYYQARTDGMAIASLVLGLVALPSVCCYGVPAVAFGVTALILGRISLGNIRASGGALAGEGLAQAGWITGVVGG